MLGSSLLQGGPSGRGKPPDDLVPALPAAAGPLLYLPRPGRMAEHPKSNSIGGFPRPFGPPCRVCLLNFAHVCTFPASGGSAYGLCPLLPVRRGKQCRPRTFVNDVRTWMGVKGQKRRART